MHNALCLNPLNLSTVLQYTIIAYLIQYNIQVYNYAIIICIICDSNM